MTEVDNSVPAILKRAKERLETVGWTQGFMARDVQGNSASIGRDAVACYCGIGAVIADAPRWPDRTPNHGRAEGALNEAVGGRWDHTFPEFNDAPGRTLPEVLAMFDVAIAAASE